MPPIKDFQCNDCGFEYEDLVKSNNETFCPHCESIRVIQLPSVVGGYKFSNGSGEGSITPKGAGSPKRSRK